MDKIIIFLILLLIFIFYEKKYGSIFERFIDTDYDYYYNGDVYLESRKKPISVGIGNNVDSRYTLNVGGTLFVRDRLCYGNTCLDAKTLKVLNDIPYFKSEELCLKTNDNEDVCVNEKHLQILTGQRALRLKSSKKDERTNTKDPQYFRRHNYYAHPNHDDNDDYPPPSCGPEDVTYSKNMCSHSEDGNGNFRGYVANPVMADFNEEKNEDCWKLDQVKWQEDFPEDNRFVLQSIPDSNPNDKYYKKYFPRVKSNFSKEPFNYKCYSST